MKVVMAAVSSIDGKITKNDDPYIYKWTSVEDKKYFEAAKKTFDVIIMGSSTFRAVLPKPEKERLRIVLTRTPSLYKNFFVPGQLEFSDESPLKLIKRLKKTKYKKIFVVGGSKINSLFLKDNLVDELWLTIEPKIFGIGKNLIDERLDLSLTLKSLEKLNNKGTLLLKYAIDNQ